MTFRGHLVFFATFAWDIIFACEECDWLTITLYFWIQVIKKKKFPVILKFNDFVFYF